ncbi:MAG TPA: glycosyltransferase family 2 protein [Candidatus Omnitrophota bacterium]|nr:glycosyltransferase family 2 protein [Candidatus Omnitrophota bacterium]
MKTLISIVMAVYNGEKYIEEQVKSILSQTYTHFELLIGDDASTDATVSIVERIARSDPRIKIHKNSKNLGSERNFLNLLRFTAGEFVCFSDQDDYWQPQKLAVLFQLLMKDARNMLAYSDLEICDEKLCITHASFWKSAGIRPRQGPLGEFAFLRNIAPGCSMMFRKSIVEKMLYFHQPQPFMHDHLALVLSANAGKIVYTPQALVRYRQHESNQIGAFYHSVVNPERIRAELTAKIKKMQENFSAVEVHGLKKLSAFCDCLRSGNFVQRVSFLKYYLFLRNDRVMDKLLGLWECLWPQGYHGLKRMGFQRGNLIWFERLVFLVWSSVVLGCFFLQFVMAKLGSLRFWSKV